MLLDDLSVSQGAAELAGTLRFHTETREVEGKLQGRRIPVSGLAELAGLAELGPAASRPVGYSATSVHTGTAETCAIFINVAAVAPALNEGEPKCT